MRVMTLGRLGDVNVDLPDGRELYVGPATDNSAGTCDPPARRRALIQGAGLGLAIGGLAGALLCTLMLRR